MKQTRLLSLVLAVVLCFSLLAGCTQSAAPEASATVSESVSETTSGNDAANPPESEADNSGDTIKIGLLAPLTGDVAQYGIGVQRGVRMYIDEINAAGGVLGKTVELVEYDEKGDAVEAVNAYNRLVSQDKVVAIIGDVTSTPTIAVAQESVEYNTPIITASATAEEVTAYGDNYFRSCFLDPFQGKTMAGYAGEILGAKTAAIIYDNGSDYSVGLAESFKATCAEMGIEVVAEETYATSDVDYKAQLTNIAAANPDVLFVPDYYNTVVLIATQAKELGLNCPKLGCDGWDGVLGVATDPSVLENCYFSNHYSSEDPDPLVQNFLNNFQSIYQVDPISFSATGYDAAMILCAAIEAAGSTDSAAIIAAMKATDMDCVTGHITFDENNNPIKSCAIITIVDGEYKLDRKY